MNVILDHIVFWLQRAGGVSTYFNELATYLGGRPELFVNNILPAQPTNSIYVKWLGTLDGIKDSRPIVLARYALAPSINEGPGVFHSSYYRRPKSNKLAKVITVYDFTYERYRGGLACFVHCQQKYKAIRSADIVICISECTKNDLLRFVPGVDPQKIRVIPLAASKEFAVLDGKENISPILLDRSFALYVGERKGYKRFDIAVGAVGMHNDLDLVIVGGQLAANEKKLLDRVLPGRWHFIGQVDNTKLNLLYNSAHVFLYTSEYEGFGIPVLEAMQAGCPVICSNHASLPEVAGDAALTVKEHTVTSFSSAIAMMSDESQRSNHIMLGLKQAEKFAWDICCSRTLDAYRDAFKNKYHSLP